MKISVNTLLYILISTIFLGVVAPTLFSDGMFSDGLYYAAIAKNMAHGLGSFWSPHYTDVIFPEFYDHPPLVFGLQSVFFRFFGDSLYVERFYSLLMFVMVGFLVVLIWREITNDLKTGWLPLLFWIAIPKVSWACANNMLENTMSVFVTAAVLFYLKSMNANRLLFIALSGFSLALGFLSKGIFSLFIWSLPFFVWACKKEYRFTELTVDTVLITIFTVLPIYGLYELYPEAANNLTQYFNRQIAGRLMHVNSVGSRFYILGKFIIEITPPVLIGFVVVMAAWRKNIELRLLKNNLNKALLFFFLTLSGVLPIMISLKQSSFYILAVYPFLALSIGILVHPLVKCMQKSIDMDAAGHKWLLGLTCGFVLISTAVSVAQFGRIGRDRIELSDCYLVIGRVGKNRTLNICDEMLTNWSFHGYFARYGNISLDPDQKKRHEYYLATKDCGGPVLANHYVKERLATKRYQLYKKRG